MISIAMRTFTTLGTDFQRLFQLSEFSLACLYRLADLVICDAAAQTHVHNLDLMLE
jgi:hypothetical protein